MRDKHKREITTFITILHTLFHSHTITDTQVLTQYKNSSVRELLSPSLSFLA